MGGRRRDPARTRLDHSGERLHGVLEPHRGSCREGRHRLRLRGGGGGGGGGGGRGGGGGGGWKEGDIT